MFRAVIALAGMILLSRTILAADCDTHIADSDTQKIIQAKMDCLVKENERLRQAHETWGNAAPGLKLKGFSLNSPQEAVTVKGNVFRWVASHHGTMEPGSDMGQPKVAGKVGNVALVAYCDDTFGLCIVVGAAPNEQDAIDAVLAIKSN